ncbi:DNA polymerase III, alpha subunit [gut metagenome]|uniref:DNA polymerase III, alpha subunit n=1 Tax=gut metagenome TaxID=749906 RepID=J9FI06_9ZZZZ
MEKYLKDTYGITVYQEQVMLLSRQIANFTRGESDALRKAMGKKLIEKLNHMYPKFIKGGTANGHDPKVLEKIWEDWRAFASYAFNKSHATCYSWVAYQTAYLKANYPSQYMAAVMSRSLADIKTITKLLDECKAMDVKTLGPDINESMLKFSVNRTGDIRFGLGAIKGVGESAVMAIIEERKQRGPFKDIYDFIERINLSACNKKNIENLALAGAFDSFETIRREQFFATNEKGETYIDVLVKYGYTFQTDQASAQNTLFGDIIEVEIAKPEPPQEYEVWSDLQRLNKECELIGIYISGHPLDEYQVVLDNICNLPAIGLEDLNEYVNQDVKMGGIITSVREGNSKTGKPYGIARIEDFSGSGELALFGQDWATWRGYINAGTILLISGRVEPNRRRENTCSLQIGKIDFMADVKEDLIKRITIQLEMDKLNDEDLNSLNSQLFENPGTTEVYLKILDHEEQGYVLLQSKNCRISVKKSLLDYIDSNYAMEYRINS